MSVRSILAEPPFQQMRRESRNEVMKKYIGTMKKAL
jgi:hypothetical protein